MASIELTVAYPGREGAHSAAACDRLFPAARLVPLPTFSDVVEAVASGRVPYGVLPIESSLVGPVAETPISSTNRRSRSWPRRSSRSTTASSAQPRSGSRTCGRSIRIPWRSTSAAGSSPHCPTRARWPRRRQVTRRRPWPTRRSNGRRDRERPGGRINALTIIDGNVGDHPEAYTRFVSSRRIPGSIGARASGGPRSRSPPTTGPAPSTERSSRSPATASTSTCSCRGRFRRVRSVPLRRGPRRPPARPEIASTLKEMRDLTTQLRVFGSTVPTRRAASWRAAAEKKAPSGSRGLELLERRQILAPALRDPLRREADEEDRARARAGDGGATSRRPRATCRPCADCRGRRR